MSEEMYGVPIPPIGPSFGGPVTGTVHMPKQEIRVVIAPGADRLAMYVGKFLKDGWKLHGEPQRDREKWVQFLKRGG